MCRRIVDDISRLLSRFKDFLGAFWRLRRATPTGVLPRLALPVTSRDRYGSDVLSTDWRAPKRGRAVEAPAELGAVVEEVTTDWCGEIVAVDRDLHTVTLEDRRGKRRTSRSGPGFLLEGSR